MEGALGNMNLTCSKIPRSRKLAARLFLSGRQKGVCDKGCARGYHPWPVSPSPWKNKTVAVCFLAAGTTWAAALLAMMEDLGLRWPAET